MNTATPSKTAEGSTEVRIGRRTLRLSRPDKVLFPDDGYTKADLVDYYRQVAPAMLPHLRGRPLMLERHPDGLRGERFIQQRIPAHFPSWMHRAEVPREGGGTVTHVVCDDTAALVYLAGQACLPLHRWQARAARPACPDLMVIDLDPPGDDFAPVRHAAHLVCDLLDEVRLPAALMTTGSRGLHAIVPLDGRTPAEEVHRFAGDLAGVLAARYPGELTTEPRRRDRRGRLYLDVGRNAYAQTAIAPYAVRALPGAPVAMPVDRSELDDPALHARRWTLADAAERVRSGPWSGMRWRGRALGPARRRLGRLRGTEERR